MPNPNEGGSADPNEEVMFSASFPYGSGGTVTNEVNNGEKPTVPNVNEPVAPVNVPATPPENLEQGKNNHADGSQNNSEQSVLSQEEQKLHNKQLDLIEDVMKQGDDTARKFFNENPEYAVIANRSKRLKEVYRSLIEKVEPSTASNKPNEGISSGKEIPASNSLPKNTNENVDSLADQIYIKNLNREQATMQSMQAEEFAKTKGINRDHFDTLLKAAKALNLETGQSFSDCLEGAHRAITGKANVKVPTIPSGGGAGASGAQAVPEKESEVTRLMGLGFDKQTAEKFYNQQYAGGAPKSQFTGKLGETFRT